MNKTSSMCMPFTCLYAALRCPRANSNALDRVKLAKISSLCAHAALEHHRRSSVAYLSFDNALAVSDLIRRIECVSQKTRTWYIQKQKHICIVPRLRSFSSACKIAIISIRATAAPRPNTDWKRWRRWCGWWSPPQIFRSLLCSSAVL